MTKIRFTVDATHCQRAQEEIFAALVAVFWFLPYVERVALALTARIRVSVCRRSAQRLTRIAHRYAPFEADYDLKGSLLTYARGKDGAWHAGWQRDLAKFRAPAVAIERPSVTLIFRRPRSLQPSIVILHDGSGWLGEVLRGAKIEMTNVTGIDQSGESVALTTDSPASP